MNRRRRIWATIAITIVLVLALSSASFTAGYVVGHSNAQPAAATTPSTTNVPGFEIFWQAWDLVRKNYVDQKAIDDKTLTYGAIQGMINALGDSGHSRFLTPEDLRDEQQSLSGQLEGIGAEVSMRDGQAVIVAPIAGSPAQKAGVMAGDVILKVDGNDVSGKSLDDIVNIIRGPAGTSVTITVIHEGQTAQTDITIVRAKINVPSVTWAMLPGTTTAHILVSQFASNATAGLVSAINDAKDKGATSIVLDLRNNPGGLLDEAIGVTSQFVKQGNVLLVQDAQGKRTPVTVRSGGNGLDIPMVVLVNNGTASAAEIVAGALQDHQRAKVIGVTTFGTGTVLSTYHLSDGSAILLGTEQWLTPDGRQIWHNGIKPDIDVELPTGATPLTPDQESNMTADQLQQSQDAQLLRALQELNNPSTPAPTTTPSP
ncbi:MAG TPA: S41 family peptidase [Nitrolancea sp.]|jgi:carboxyl-terminal processing protease|nr:S41 family peptidase [Nitrolancea sp.]